MKGCISQLFIEKNYGFINGVNGQRYFFHTSNLASISERILLLEGVILEFDELETKKGLQAKNIKVIDINPPNTYDLFFGITCSKNSSVKDHEVLDSSYWYVSGAARGAPSGAKQKMLQRAQHLGANAVLNVSYFTTTGSESGTGKGVHHYTIHNYKGRLAVIGRKNPFGETNPEDIKGTINPKARLLKEQLSKKTKKKQLVVFPLIIIGAICGYFLGNDIFPNFNPVSGLFFSMLIVFLIYNFSGTLDYDHWLTASTCDYDYE